jgi:hypothetical protein
VVTIRFILLESLMQASFTITMVTFNLVRLCREDQTRQLIKLQQLSIYLWTLTDEQKFTFMVFFIILLTLFSF